VPLNFVAKIAITAALTAAQMALTASQKFEGQRLDDLKVTIADPGTPIPRFWGVHRFDGCADRLGRGPQGEEGHQQDQGRQVHQLQILRHLDVPGRRPRDRRGPRHLARQEPLLPDRRAPAR
jgi:hypothetical protein